MSFRLSVYFAVVEVATRPAKALMACTGCYTVMYQTLSEVLCEKEVIVWPVRLPMVKGWWQEDVLVPKIRVTVEVCKITLFWERKGYTGGVPKSSSFCSFDTPLLLFICILHIIALTVYYQI